MRILFDATPETMYPLATEGFSGGSQTYIRAIIRGLVERGHTVHVIANDLQVDEQRGECEFWWPREYHPHQFDVAIQQMHVNSNPDYDAPILVLMTSCVDPNLGPDHQWASQIDAYPLFSETHKRLLLQLRPTVPEDRCHVTGLGVDLADYSMPTAGYVKSLLPGDYEEAWRNSHKSSTRLLYANDPARGLFYTLDVFDHVRREVTDATLHVAYDFDRQLSWHAWDHSQIAQLLWECKRRLGTTPGVVNVGGLPRADLIREQLECQVHCMPSDPPALGTQTHGITQMECAAAGAALVLSDVEAFPEVFSEGATILPVIGRYLPDQERRVDAQDYAAVVVELMRDRDKWEEASRKARALAEKHTWDIVCDRWEEMLSKLMEGVKVA